ncbi:MAG: FAD-dependent oxidoreductase [Micrococcales bacterium]|nr:FAD-dependent oxidoreductase [Micrococcales bacterium]
MDTIVVIGAGLAGGTAVTELRAQGHEGPIVLFGSEPHPPYERPPLSKGYLLGNESIDTAFVHEPGWYAEHDVDLRTSTTVTGLDLDARVVRTAEGEQRYDRLLIATGAQPRRLAMADEAAPTAYLRTIEDSDRIKSIFGADRRIVIVGAGWIGLEVAAAARASDTAVTVFESAALPLMGVLGPQIAQVFADLHREHGVDLRLGASVSADDLAGADLVVVGIGAIPSTELAETAGLDVDNGVLVDATLQTSRPGVYAIGDIANHDHPVLRRRIRVEHWDTAIEQAKVAARNMLGHAEPYERLPYFFTDQYDLGMEYVGRAGRDAQVVVQGELADVNALNFRAFWVEDGLVTAGMHVNDWDATDAIREQIGKPLA